MDLLREAPGAEIVFEAVAGEERVYVVGGAVRDALLGRIPKELDLVVEGDAIERRPRAAERINGSLLVHERFRTATVSADGFSFDIASARKETYPRPGALPDVQAGRDDRRGPRPPRLHGQRDRARHRPRPRDRVARRAPGRRAPDACRSCTSAASSTTRRGCCGSSATPRASAFNTDERTTSADRPAPDRHGDRRPARQRAAARAVRTAHRAWHCSSAPASART